MPTFTTVFEISKWSNGVLADTLFRLFIGFSALIGGLTTLAFAFKRGTLKTTAAPAIFVIGWSVLWIGLHLFPYTFGHIHHLVSAYEQKQYQVLEGPVEVLFQQPYTGHTSGDKIRIGGTTLVVSYFYATPAYRQTISHGGVLKSGVYVRVYVVDGEIVRVDVRQPHP